MTYSQSKESTGRKKANTPLMVTICGTSVQLVFTAESNGKIPEIVGQILKGAYLQRQSV